MNESVDKELLNKVEDLIDGKNEHLKFTSSFLGFCAHFLSIKPKANKDFEQSLRERLLERHRESAQVASSQTEGAGRGNLHQAGDRLKALIYGAFEIPGKVFRQPAWKTATIGVLALVLIIGVTVVPPAVAEFFSTRRLQEIVRNCPEVQAFFGEEVEIRAFPVWLDGVRDGISKVVIEGVPAWPAVPWCPWEMERLLPEGLIATGDLRKGKVIEIHREIGAGEWGRFCSVGACPLRPLPVIPVEELRGKTHGEFLERIDPVFLDRVPLDMQEKLFTMRFNPDPPETLCQLPKRTYDPGIWHPRLVRPGVWSELQFVSEERPALGRWVKARAGTGIGWPPPPCEKLVIIYLLFEGEVISSSWDFSSRTLNSHGIFLGVGAQAIGRLTESGKVWTKGLHLVRDGDEIEVTITNSDAVFVEIVYPTMPRITPEKEQETTAIAGAHPLVEEFLDTGAYLAGAGYIPARDERDVWYVPCTDMVNVNMRLVETPPVPPVERDWSVTVNIAEKSVESIRETKITSKAGVEAGRKYVVAVEIVKTYLYPEIREVMRDYFRLEPGPLGRDWLRTQEDVYFCEERQFYLCRTTGEPVWPTADPGIWTEDRIWPMPEDTVRP